MRRGDEDERHEVVTDAACHLQDQGQEDEGKHQAAAGHVLERAAQGHHHALPVPHDLFVGEERVRIVDVGGAVQPALQPPAHDGRGGSPERPHEHQGLSGDDGDDRGGEAGEDVADARAGGDHREDALALEQVEVLGGEAPEVDHHELEGDRVDDVRGERDRRRLAEVVDGEKRQRHHSVDGEVHAQRPAHAEPAGHRALQRDHRPHRQREDDEEQRVGLRAGLGEEDGLRRVEGGVHRPADQDREAGDLKRAVELGAADVEESGEDRRGCHRVGLSISLCSLLEVWRRPSPEGRRTVVRSQDRYPDWVRRSSTTRPPAHSGMSRRGSCRSSLCSRRLSLYRDARRTTGPAYTS